MKYAELVVIYENLESTTKKLVKRDVIAGFLKKAPAEKLPILAMLVRGRIFPDWDETELGIAKSIMIKTISKTTGIGEKGVAKAVKEAGDTGSAVEELLKKKKQRTLVHKELTVDKVYENLRKIPELAGAGSVEKKIALVSDLLSLASPKEGKYIARTILEELRVGVAEGLVRDAISVAFDVDVKTIEHAYNIRNDFGEIAQIAREKGAKGLEKIEMKLGRPLKPMLAQKVDTIEKGIKDMGGKAAFEIKYDGMRIQVHKEGAGITLFTRRLDDVTKQFPEIVEYAGKCITAKNCLIEGEVVGMNPKTRRPYPFQKLSRRIKRKYDIKEMAEKIPVEVNLFDIMYLEGKSMIKTPFEERRKMLERIIKPIKGKFQLAEQVVTGDANEAEKLFKKAIKMGHEGVMVKNLGSEYTPGSRVKHMYKIKPVQESLDLAIIGAIWGEGRRSKWLGSYILGAKDPETEEFVEVGKVATGLTDEDLQTLTDILKPIITKEHVNRVEIKPKLIVEVSYEEIQKSPTYESGFALRFPRVVNIRDDKGPEDVATTEQISKLFGSQRHKK